MGLTFLTTRSASERLRIVLLAVLGAVIAVLVLAALLSIGEVATCSRSAPPSSRATT